MNGNDLVAMISSPLFEKRLWPMILLIPFRGPSKTIIDACSVSMIVLRKWTQKGRQLTKVYRKCLYFNSITLILLFSFALVHLLSVQYLLARLYTVYKVPPLGSITVYWGGGCRDMSDKLQGNVERF